MKKIVCLMLALMLAVPSFVIAGETEILFTNSFEYGMTGWKYYNNDAFFYTKISDLCASSGEKSVYIYDPDNNVATGVATDYLSIEEGETVSVSVDSYVAEGKVKVFLKFFNNDQTQIESHAASSTVGKWENVVITKTAPEKAKYLRLVICSVSGSTGKAYFDNAKVVKGELQPYEITNATYPSEEEKWIDETEIVIPEIKAPEILYRDSFEDGIGYWSQHSESQKHNVIVNGDKAYDGKKSVLFVDESEKYAPGIKSPLITIEPGENYTIAAYFYSIANKSIKVWVKFFDKDEKSIYSGSNITKTDNVWTEISCTGKAPDNAVYARFLVAGGSTTLGKAYVDDVRFYKGIYTAKSADYTVYNPPLQTNPTDAKLISPVNNKLVYNTYNDKGDKLSDFSYAGFYGGDYELPVSESLPVVETLFPTGKDDTIAIQNALNKAERKDGGINIVKLKAGTFNVNGRGLKIPSGVLLSGEGQGPTGTIIYAYTPIEHTVIKIAGVSPQDVGNKAFIQDDYVSAGSKTINVSLEDAANFRVGDTVAIYHNSTEEWAKAIKMYGVINVYGDDTTWLPDKVNMITERTITKISGTELTFDYGVFVPYIKEFVPSYITKIDDSKKVENAGVENLRIVSYYNGSLSDEDHGRVAISITDAKNIFVRDVTGKHFVFAVVSSGKRAKQVTVRNCTSLEPISLIIGSRRYSFASSTSAQQILYTGCLSHDGRHDFETSYSVTGPISYVDNVVDSGNTATETHGTWSTGVLFDNIYHIGHDTQGVMAFANRGKAGTQLSQGWSSAGSVMWNCLSSAILVHKPPLTYQNFSFGIWGFYDDPDAQTVKSNYIKSSKSNYRTGESTEYTEENFETDENTSLIGDGYKESKYAPVNPRSLYKAQLSERYTGVITNARPNAPVVVFPKMDKVTKENNVKVSGIFQLGAEKVTVYIDNVAYNATLKPETNEFEYNAVLEDGVHKIYATQTIDGVEGNKNADRFITIGEANGNPDYLQSIYPVDSVRMIVNDPRLTYDVAITNPEIKDASHSVSGNKHMVSFFLNKGNGKFNKANVIVAIYNKAGKLAGVKKEEKSDFTKNINIEVESSDEAGLIKIFVWQDMGDLKPVCKLYEIYK